MAIRVVKERLKTLCATCKNSQIREYDDGGFFIECGAASSRMGLVVNRPVIECSSYQQKLSLGKHEAYAIGWVLEVKKGKAPRDQQEGLRGG